jgi:hypothetical protein
MTADRSRYAEDRADSGLAHCRSMPVSRALVLPFKNTSVDQVRCHRISLKAETAGEGTASAWSRRVDRQVEATSAVVSARQKPDGSRAGVCGTL